MTTLIVEKAPVGQHYNLEAPGKETTTVAIINLLQCQRSFHKQDMIHGLFVTCKLLTYSGEGSGLELPVDFKETKTQLNSNQYRKEDIQHFETRY